MVFIGFCVGVCIGGVGVVVVGVFVSVVRGFLV